MGPSALSAAFVTNPLTKPTPQRTPRNAQIQTIAPASLRTNTLQTLTPSRQQPGQTRAEHLTRVCSLRDADSGESGTPHKAFTQKLTQDLPALQARLEVYEHTKTGAQHFHLATPEHVKEKAMAIAFKTLPTDSTGVAHILEHTVLAGSKNYQVKDPFFSMIRRSMNTFMNAMTSSDWTLYPFATQNEKDFFNLMSVYQDAVFFPLLDELAFSQEGHRLEFKNPSDPASPLQYKGVVFNEMKGAMSSSVREVYQQLMQHLFPKSTYRHNAGGDPADIPDLSYDAFKDFHSTHYHPSNAAFFTYGALPATKIQDQIQTQVLSHFEPGKSITIAPEHPQLSPLQVHSHYALDSTDTTQKTYHTVGWVLGSTANTQERLEASLLEQVLFGDSASPVQQFLEHYPHATSPSGLNGLSDDAVQMSFMCGIQGSDPEHAKDFEEKLMAVLQKVADEGIPLPKLENACDQLEFSQREIRGGRMPVGLTLLMKLLPSAIYDSKPTELLDQKAALSKLRQEIQDPNKIKSMLKRLLLNNPHRVFLTTSPDSGLNEKKAAAEAAELEHIQSSLTDAEKSQIISRSAALSARQNAVDDPSVLPKLTLQDIPDAVSWPQPAKVSTARTITIGPPERAQTLPTETLFQAGTNGISYVETAVPLPKLTDHEKALLPLYTALVTNLGVGDQDYLAMQGEQTAVSGGMHSNLRIHADPANVNAQASPLLGLSIKSLNKNIHSASMLLQETFHHVRFDESQRVKELISQMRTSAEQTITQSGHLFARMAAASGLNNNANLSEQLSGLTSINTLQKLDDHLKAGKDIKPLMEVLSNIHKKVTKEPQLTVAVSDLAPSDALIETIAAPRKRSSNDMVSESHFKHAPELKSENQLWVTQSSVNYCAKAYPGVPATHQDAPALRVLASLLSSQYLHKTVREAGGAYGGGASYNTAEGSFSFYSYRDPRDIETLADFDGALAWLKDADITQDMLEESILSVVSNLDAPSTPAIEAKDAFFNTLAGKNESTFNDFRKSVQSVKAEDLKRVAATYLKPEAGTVAIVTSEKGYDKIKQKSNIDFVRHDV